MNDCRYKFGGSCSILISVELWKPLGFPCFGYLGQNWFLTLCSPLSWKGNHTNNLYLIYATFFCWSPHFFFLNKIKFPLTLELSCLFFFNGFSGAGVVSSKCLFYMWLICGLKGWKLRQKQVFSTVVQKFARKISNVWSGLTCTLFLIYQAGCVFMIHPLNLAKK